MAAVEAPVMKQEMSEEAADGVDSDNTSGISAISENDDSQVGVEVIFIFVCKSSSCKLMFNLKKSISVVETFKVIFLCDHNLLC